MRKLNQHSYIIVLMMWSHCVLGTKFIQLFVIEWIEIDSETESCRNTYIQRNVDAKRYLWTKLINRSEGLSDATSLICLKKPISKPVNSRSNRFTRSEKVSVGASDDSVWNAIIYKCLLKNSESFHISGVAWVEHGGKQHFFDL